MVWKAVEKLTSLWWHSLVRDRCLQDANLRPTDCKPVEAGPTTKRAKLAGYRNLYRCRSPLHGLPADFTRRPCLLVNIDCRYKPGGHRTSFPVQLANSPPLRIRGLDGDDIGFVVNYGSPASFDPQPTRQGIDEAPCPETTCHSLTISTKT